MNNGLEIIAKKISTINDKEIKQLNLITAKCFGNSVPLDETRKQFEEAEMLSLLMQKGEIRGYGLNSQIQLNGTTINYFGSGFIDPQLQDKDVYAELNLFRSDQLPTEAIMTRTQNPKVYSGFMRLCQERGFLLSPDHDSKIDSPSLELAKAFSFRGGGAFSSECNNKQTCRGIYERELMGNTPLPNEATRKVMGELNVSNGDAIILVGRSYN